ncbi:MAG: tetraacyldisaccharide 4'-kinase [Prevotellaceae bacterium]|jgi:tetraacyldisaccharide 4'-kinase|nr:tetraacyldisaccharide 4'-kinase [Prevotellaceae bacterium]
MLNFLKIIASLFYGAAVVIRNKLYDTNIFVHKEINDVVTIVVGNITVGGTGKTPHSEFLLNNLQKDFKVALLSRGYKRKTKNFRYVETTSTAIEVGDEPLQIKRKFPDVIVAVDADRVRGVKYIKEKYPDIDVIVLDDAFQHRRLKPSLSVLLCNYWRPINKDKMLPWGTLRDEQNQKCRADIVFVTKCPQTTSPIDMRIVSHDLNLMPYQQLFFTTLEYGELISVFDANKPAKTDKIVALAGIANPKLFEEYISANFAKPRMLQFSDHHNFSQKDIKNICKNIDENELFITTEKDAMRLMLHNNFSEEQKAKMFYLPIKIKFLNNTEEKITTYLIDYVKKYKACFSNKNKSQK